jgi:hypothetical protein
VLVAGGLLAAPDAAAQAPAALPGVTNGNLTGPVVGGTGGYTARRVQPPALPGARPGAIEASPPDRPPSDMHPNEALFDAIVRGDVAAARDALARGADLNARNVLGMTPLESSIDLNRNDITFLMISLRGSASGDKPAAQASGKPGALPPAGKARQAEGKVAAAPRPAPTPKSAPAPRSVPAQYANVPSTPVPQAGFLGFGGGPDGKTP